MKVRFKRGRWEINKTAPEQGKDPKPGQEETTELGCSAAPR